MKRIFYDATLMGPDSIKRTGLTAAERQERADFIALAGADRQAANYMAKEWDAMHNRR